MSLFRAVPAINKGRPTVWQSWMTKKCGWVAGGLPEHALVHVTVEGDQYCGSAVNTAGTAVLAQSAIFRHSLKDKTSVGFALFADIRFAREPSIS